MKSHQLTSWTQEYKMSRKCFRRNAIEFSDTTGQGFDRFSQLWDQNKEKRWFRRVYLGEKPTAADDAWRLWYRTILDYDPVPLLEQLPIPRLSLFGDPRYDRFGPVQLSVDRLNAMRDSGKDYEIVVFTGADHNLRFVDGGKEAPFEDTISAWLDALDRQGQSKKPE